MQEEPGVQVTRAQVVDKLALRDRSEERRCFDLDGNAVCHQYIESKESDLYSSIEHLDWYLLPRVYSLTR